MKQKKISITLIATLILALCLGLMAGCGEKKIEIETETLKHTALGHINLSIDVPKDKGYKIAEEPTKHLNGEPSWSNFVIETEKATIYYNFETFVYQTHVDFEKNHPDLDKDNPNFDDFLKAVYPKEKTIDLNGSKAIKKSNSISVDYSDTSKKTGIIEYFVDANDKSAYLQVTVLAKKENTTIEDLEKIAEEPEIKVILDSLKIKNSEPADKK